jgi:PhnB protein
MSSKSCAGFTSIVIDTTSAIVPDRRPLWEEPGPLPKDGSVPGAADIDARPRSANPATPPAHAAGIAAGATDVGGSRFPGRMITYPRMMPWLVSQDTAALLDFLARAFGAEEIARVHNPDGSIGHAEAQLLGEAVIAFDSPPGWPATPALLRLTVDDAAAAFDAAIAAGASPVTRVTELFWGDAVGRICDPFGNVWWLQSQIRQVDPEELGELSQRPENLAAMAYVQDSLDEWMRGRHR